MAIAEVTTHACKETACSSYSSGGGEFKTTLAPVWTVEDLADPTQFQILLNEISQNLDDRFQKEFSLDQDLIQLCAVTNGAVVMDLGKSCKFHIETDEDINSITICCFDSHCSPTILIENTGGNPISVTGWPASTTLANNLDNLIVEPGNIGAITLAVDPDCDFSGGLEPPEEIVRDEVRIPSRPRIPYRPVIRPCTPRDRGRYVDNFTAEQTVATDRYEFDMINNTGIPGDNAFDLRVAGLKWQFAKSTGGGRIRGIAKRRFTIHFPTEGSIDSLMFPPARNRRASYGVGLGSGSESSFDGYAMFLERDADLSMHVRAYRLFGADAQNESSGGDRSGFTILEETTYPDRLAAFFKVSRCGVPGLVIFTLNSGRFHTFTEPALTLAGPGTLFIYENGPAASGLDSAGTILSIVHEGVNVFG